eukprot:UN31582
MNTFQENKPNLKKAMSLYYEAKFATDGREKAQLIFYANCLVGLEEQAFLQPEIELAFLKNFGPFDLSWLVTKLMFIVCPGEILSCSKNLTPLSNGKLWAETLDTLDTEELTKFYHKWGPKTNTMEGTAATNWTSLGDRMKYVLPLMRSRHNDVQLCRLDPLESIDISAVPELTVITKSINKIIDG